MTAPGSTWTASPAGWRSATGHDRRPRRRYDVPGRRPASRSVSTENGDLVGCARAITDFARFAYLSDVFIEPEHRGQGLGRWLVQTMLEHPDVPNVRWVLHTSDAHGLYRQFGFEPGDETVMQRSRTVLGSRLFGPG